jgi:hypothetical protein
MFNLLVNCVYGHIGKGRPQSTAGTAVTHGRVGRTRDLPARHWRPGGDTRPGVPVRLGCFRPFTDTHLPFVTILGVCARW